MTKEPKWKEERLNVEDVREHPMFQMRVAGIDKKHTKRLQTQLENGDTLPPIEVAKVGKALYVIDGFHRLDAHRASALGHIDAKVARMSLGEARAKAATANLKHGKGPSRADKQAAFDAFIDSGAHIVREGEESPLNLAGSFKSSRKIAAELGGIYSHVTIRTKLKQCGIEISEEVEYPHGYKPMDLGAEESLEVELAAEANEALWHFHRLYHSVEEDTQRDLLETARSIVTAISRGKKLEQPNAAGMGAVLDI